MEWPQRYLATWIVLHAFRWIAIASMLIGGVLFALALKFTAPKLAGEPYSKEREASIDRIELERAANSDQRVASLQLFAGGMLAGLLATIAIAIIDMSACVQEEARMNALYRRKP
jgi:hypothetical protein